MSQADETAQAAVDIAAATGGVVSSPAGVLIPPDWKFYISMASAIALGLANGWQAFRNSQTKNALEEVVIGNEAVKSGKDFKEAQAAAQSASTVKQVAQIRKEIAA